MVTCSPRWLDWYGGVWYLPCVHLLLQPRLRRAGFNWDEFNCARIQLKKCTRTKWLRWVRLKFLHCLRSCTCITPTKRHLCVHIRWRMIYGDPSLICNIFYWQLYYIYNFIGIINYHVGLLIFSCLINQSISLKYWLNFEHLRKLTDPCKGQKNTP